MGTKQENLISEHNKLKTMWFLDFLQDTFLSSDQEVDSNHPLIKSGFKHYQDFLDEEYRKTTHNKQLNSLYQQIRQLLKEIEKDSLFPEDHKNRKKHQQIWQEKIKKIKKKLSV